MNTFKLQDLILEGRLEDVKKKFPEVNTEIVDYLSQNDPSGNNKYLEWMVSNIVRLGLTRNKIREIRDIIEGEFLSSLRKFHENINKITPELVHEVYQTEGWMGLMKDNSPTGKMLQKIFKTPKDINSYTDLKEGALTILSRIANTAAEKLTKAEIKKLESNVLLNNQDLLILIPKSYKASCYYGAGTRWCTTNKSSDTYYNRYTSNGTLIYVIDKKSTMENPWYRTAFFIDKSNGDAQAFDAPDNPTSIVDASKHLGDKWETIRDTIVEYLHANNLKGIENFYVGADLITWLESKGLDPLKFMDGRKLVSSLGYDVALGYLKKRGVDIFDFFNMKMLFDVFVTIAPNMSEGVKNLWDEFKKRDINPVGKFFHSNHISHLITAIDDRVLDLDDFLDQSLKYYKQSGESIFSLIEYNYGSGGDTVRQLYRIFHDSDLIFGFADLLNVNLFRILSPRTMRVLVGSKFDGNQRDILLFVIENRDSLRGDLSEYGFDNDDIIATLDKETLNELIESNALRKLTLNDFIKIYGNSVETFWKYFDNFFGLNGREDKWVDEYDIYPVIERNSNAVARLFPNIMDLQNAMRERVSKTFNIFDLNIRYIFKFVDEDYYSLYKILKEGKKLHDLNDLLLIKAYMDAPHDDTEIKSLVMERIDSQFETPKSSNYVLTENGKNYIITFNLCEYSRLFMEHSSSDFLCDDYLEYDSLHVDDLVNYIDKEPISNLIKEYLMTNLRNTEITLNMDWVDEFDTWVENINDVDGTFNFVLYDERIMGMSDHKLEVIIAFSQELKPFRNILMTSLNQAYKNILYSTIEKGFLKAIGNVLGDSNPSSGSDIEVWNQYRGEMVNRKGYKIEYTHLLDDIVHYADYYAWHEDGLPDNIIRLIYIMMREEIGRFDSRINFDIDEVIEDNYSILHGENLVEEFANILYDNLEDLNSNEPKSGKLSS